MSMLRDFKAFISNGNVVDLAIGVILGAAFGAIVTSLVSDILTPPIGYFLGGVKFDELVTVLKEADANGKGAVTINWGRFVQTIVNFVVVAFCVFFFVRFLFSLKRAQPPGPPAPPSKQEELLTEIRDLLKQKA